MVNVNMDEYAEQSCQDLSAQGDEASGKWYIGRYRKHTFVVYLTLNPIHQVFHVLWCWQGCWLLELITVGPQILVPWTAAHCWACRFIAVLRNGTVNQIDSIEKINNWCEMAWVYKFVFEQIGGITQRTHHVRQSNRWGFRRQAIWPLVVNLYLIEDSPEPVYVMNNVLFPV